MSFHLLSSLIPLCLVGISKTPNPSTPHPPPPPHPQTKVNKLKDKILHQHKPQIATTPAPQNSTCTSTPNCMPPSLLSIAQNARAVAPNSTATNLTRTPAPQTASNRIPQQHLHLHPKLHAIPPYGQSICMPPSTRPSISHKGAAPSPAPQTRQTARQNCTRSPCHQSCKKAPALSQAPHTAPQTAHPNSICASTSTARHLAPSRQSRKSLSPLY